MPTITTYTTLGGGEVKWVPGATGLGGQGLNTNFKALADAVVSQRDVSPAGSPPTVTVTPADDDFASLAVDPPETPRTPNANNSPDGLEIVLRLKQGGSAGVGHTVGAWLGLTFGTDVPIPTLSVAPYTDILRLEWRAAASKWDVVSVVRGYA